MTGPHNNGPKDHMRIVFVLLFLAMLLGSFTHCVIEPPKSATKKNSRGTSSSTAPEETSSPAPNVPSPAPDPVPVADPGRTHFDQVVLPNFQNNCMVCHADPATNPPLPGPLTIYNYDLARAKLVNGTSATDNELLNKIRDIVAHTGGNRCPGGVTDTVCQVVVDWFNEEMTTAPPSPTPAPTPDPVVDGVVGMISAVSSTGKATGYAADSSDPSKTVEVNFYLDGPSGAGILLNNNPVDANLTGFNGGVAGVHAFNYYIPILYRDGFSHTLHVYAVDNGMETELQGSPYTFTAYTSNIDGFNYYNGTVKPLLDTNCASCHAFSYDQNFASLLTPSPANGGTATNNEMINMPSGGSMGRNHPGGNICGSKDNSPCAEIQTWWIMEFN